MTQDPSRQPSDEELMLAHVAGDAQAFDTLFRRRAPDLLRLVRRHLSESDLARDIVQQTFVQLHTARHDFRKDAKLRPWLHTIAMNLVRQHYRRSKVRKERPLSEGAALPDEAKPLPLERAQQAAQLQEALGTLPATQREVVMLHWFEEKSFAQVATLLDSSEGAVRVRAHRAYTRLREILGKPE